MIPSGSASVAADDLVLTIEGMRANHFAIVFTGPGQAHLPFGDGLRCVAPPFFRYPPRSSNAQGTVVYGPGEIASFANSNFGPLGHVDPGDSWNYQGWYRDPTGPCGTSFNLSNAVNVLWQ